MISTLIKGLNFPEGPAFGKNGTIWLVEKEAGNLIYYHNQKYERIPTGGHPNGIAIDNIGNIWFCDSLNNSIRKYVPHERKCYTMVEQYLGQPLKMPNDLCFDKHNNLLFTCPGDRLDDNCGYICCLYSDGKLRIIHSGMYYPNGLAFHLDGNSLFIAETGSKWIWKSQWDHKKEKLENLEKFSYVGGNVGPDGLAFDKENSLYVALYGSNKIVILNTIGQPIDEITLKHPNPTNCAMDPEGKQGLVITEASKGELLRFQSNQKGLL